MAGLLKAGLIGGMSWESTVLYYQSINRGIRDELGGLHSAPLLMASLDFAEIEALQHQGDWSGAGKILNEAARSLQRAGADFIVICTNTMHKVSTQTMDSVNVPLLHIVDPTAAAINSKGLGKIGLLGTGFTMADDFYKGRMADMHGIDVLVPDESGQRDVHRIIYEELCLGSISDASRDTYLKVIDDLAARGAEGVILGCTEITLLVQQHHTGVTLFDTTEIHANAVVQSILSADR